MEDKKYALHFNFNYNSKVVVFENENDLKESLELIIFNMTNGERFINVSGSLINLNNVNSLDVKFDDILKKFEIEAQDTDFVRIKFI